MTIALKILPEGIPLTKDIVEEYIKLYLQPKPVPVKKYLYSPVIKKTIKPVYKRNTGKKLNISTSSADFSRISDEQPCNL